MSEYVWNKMVENQEDEDYLLGSLRTTITAAYPDEWDEYASSTLKYHVGDMLDYTVTKAAGIMKNAVRREGM